MIAPIFNRPSKLGAPQPEHLRNYAPLLNAAGIVEEPQVVRDYRARVGEVERAAREADEAAQAVTVNATARRIAAGEDVDNAQRVAALTAPWWRDCTAQAVEVVRGQWPAVLAEARPELWAAAQVEAGRHLAVLLDLAASDWDGTSDFDDLARRGYFDLSKRLAAAIEAAGMLAHLHDAVPMLTGQHYAQTGDAARLYRNAPVWVAAGGATSDRSSWAEATAWRPSFDCVAAVVRDIRERELEPWFPSPSEHDAAVVADRKLARSPLG